MHSLKKITIAVAFFFIFFVLPLTGNAQLNLLQPKEIRPTPNGATLDTTTGDAATFAKNAGYNLNAGSIEVLIGTIIQAFLGLLGVIFLGLIIYGGFRWFMAQGEEEEVTKAKDIIRQAVFGLIIILAAYAVAAFVITKLTEKTLTSS